MGYELQKLMNMYGVSTSTMAAAPQMPGAAPTALAEGATAEQQAKYATDKAAFDESVRKYGLDKAQYDQYAQEYQNRLANTNLYNQAQFSTTGANVPAFTTYSDAQKAALGYGPAVTPTVGAPTVGGGEETVPVMPQPGPDASNPNPVVNPLRVLAGETKTQYLERVKGMGAPGRGQNAPPGMMFGPNDALVPDPNSGGTILPISQLNPQNFTGTGQGGLNQQIQNYMSTNPSTPDLNAYMTRYGITDYDIRNAMGTGTTYGAPQWTDMLASPVYGANYDTGTVGTTTGGTTTGGTTDTTGTTGTTDTGTGGTTTGGTTGTTGATTGTVYNPYQAYWNDPNWKGSDAYNQWVEWKNSNRARGGYIKNYAQGGAVQGYRRGGPPGTIYGGAGDDMLMGGSEEDTLPPVDPNAALEAMLNRYAPQTVTSEQIAAASERRLAEQKAFEDILRSQLQSTDSNPMSKAEKYFRLAAAFGAPTKTGHFSENLALVGQTLAEDLAAKAQREREARERGLGVELEIQKMRMGTAGEEYDALRGVQSEEAKYRRDVANELLKEQIASGKAGYTQVTGAELGLTGDDAGKMFNVSPEGQVTAIGGAGTTVNVGGGSQDKLDEEFAKLDAKSLAEVSTTGMQAIRNIGRLDHLETILADSPQGLEGAAKLFAGEFGINTEGLDSAQTAQAVINSLVPEQRAPGSGPMSDADLALFKQSLPRIINQPGGNEMILNTLRAIAQYDAEGAAIVQQFRAKEIDSVKAFELLQARENPLANFRAPGATEGSGGGSTIRTWNPETQELE